MSDTARRARTDMGQARRCTSPRGCSQPALDGRWFCREHVAEVERRAAGLRDDAINRRDE